MNAERLRQVSVMLLQDANERQNLVKKNRANPMPGADPKRLEGALQLLEAEAKERKSAAIELQDFSFGFKGDESAGEPLRAAARAVAQSRTVRTGKRDIQGNILVSIREDVIDALRRQVSVRDKEDGHG